MKNRIRAGLPQHIALPTCVVLLATVVGVALLTRRSSESRVDAAETKVRTASVWASRAARAHQPWHDSFTRELEKIEAEPDVVTHDEHLDRLLAEFDSSSAPHLLEQLQSESPSRTRRAAQLRLIRRWAESIPRAAANWLDRMSPDVRMDSISQVAVAWAQRDGVAATVWAKSLEERERENAIAHIADEAVRTNPKLAFELARELPAGETRNNLLLHAAAEMVATGKAEAALAFVTEATDESLHERLLSVIFASMAETDPVAAATAAAQRLPSRRPRDNAAMSIVQRWLQTDQGAASEWVNSFPEGELRRTGRLAVEQVR